MFTSFHWQGCSVLCGCLQVSWWYFSLQLFAYPSLALWASAVLFPSLNWFVFLLTWCYSVHNLHRLCTFSLQQMVFDIGNVQMKFLHLLSSEASQSITFHCLSYQPSSTADSFSSSGHKENTRLRFRGWNKQMFEKDTLLEPHVLQDECKVMWCLKKKKVPLFSSLGQFDLVVSIFCGYSYRNPHIILHINRTVSWNYDLLGLIWKCKLISWWYALIYSLCWW